jgi:hypothetical protein
MTKIESFMTKIESFMTKIESWATSNIQNLVSNPTLFPAGNSDGLDNGCLGAFRFYLTNIDAVQDLIA